MEKDVRSKLRHIFAFLGLAWLYLLLASSQAMETWTRQTIGTNLSVVNTFLVMSLIVLSSVILLINLYSYSIFREVRYLLFTVLALLLTTLYGLQLLVRVERVIKSPFSELVMTQLNIIIMISMLIILLAKLFFVRHDIYSKLPLRQVPVLLGMIVALLVVLYFVLRTGATFNNQWIMAILFLLIFSNILGYLIKYVSASDQYAESILFVGIVHLATFIYPPFGENLSGYTQLIASLMRVISLAFMSHAFYKHLFQSYLGQMVEADKAREAYTTNLEQLVEERTQRLKAANSILEEEIDSAKELQRSMMPAKDISYRAVSFVSENIACDKMSGDFFDIYDIDDHRVGMYILDVSGHGINAALMNIYCYHYIRSTSPLVKRYLGDKPSRNLLHLYQEFNKMGFPDEMHMVLLIAAYDMRNKRLTYCSGGLNGEPIVVHRSGEISRLNQSSGFPIVKMGEYFEPEYVDATIDLEAGDRIIFYTDGLVDVRQPFDMMEEDLLELMLRYADRPLSQLHEAINARIEPFRSDLVDDVSFIILEVEE